MVLPGAAEQLDAIHIDPCYTRNWTARQRTTKETMLSVTESTEFAMYSNG